MNKINRPTASNYNALDEMRETLSGKADSVFSYRKVNPYSIVFDKLQRDNNENFSTELWQQASDKGELDQYINLLSQNNKKSTKLDELRTKYAGFVDYDTTMLALSYDAITDDTKEERFDSNGNSIGSFSQKEILDKVLANQALQWDAKILEDAKKSGSFWQKAEGRIKSMWAETSGFVLNAASAATRVVDQSIDTIYGATEVLDKWMASGMNMSLEQISAEYAKAVTSTDRGLDIGLDPTELSENIKELALDIRRKYSYHMDAVTGEADGYGKILTGMADSIGYMSLAMITGNPAAMYVPMFTGNVQENVALSGPNVNYTKMISNAALKSGVEFGIEYGLGKLLGFSAQDTMIGFADDVLKVSQKAVSSGVKATTRQAVGKISAQLARDMLKEGTEEVLQELSGVFIDYLYKDQYAARAKETFTVDNFVQSFVIGAITSFAIGSFSNLTLDRATGVDASGLTYKMGLFQTISYKQSLSTMASWQKIATDPKASIEDKTTALLKLQGVTATLGSVYESVGIENTIKAEKLLMNIQQQQDRQASIKQKVQNGVYINDMLTNLDNEFGGKNWTTAYNDVINGTNALMYDMQEAGTQHEAQSKIDKKTAAMYQSVSRGLHNTDIQNLAAAMGMTTIKSVTDTTGEVAPGTIFDIAKTLGFNVVVKTDGYEIVNMSQLTSEQVLLIPESMNDADTQALLKEVVTQNTINNIMTNIPAKLLTNVIDTFSATIGIAGTKYSEADMARKAIAALMFDKNFQLKMLLQTKENRNTWGTDAVIDFIVNLKKMVARKYTTSKTETTASGKGKRVLSDITKNITERVVKSIGDSLVVFNTTVKRRVTADKNGKIQVDSTLANILSKDQLDKLEANYNIRVSAILDALAKDQMKITTEIDTMLSNIATNLLADDHIQLIVSIMATKSRTLPSQIALKSRMIKILASGDKNARTDLVANLTTTMSYSDLLAKSKAVYIPVDNSNLHEFPEAAGYKLAVEKNQLGGQSIEDVINGEADYAKLPEHIVKIEDDFKSNDVSRIYVINQLMKQGSNNRFGILQNGGLVRITDSREFVKANIVEAVNNNTLPEAIAQLTKSKKDGVIVLQDFFTATLPKSITNMPLIITHKPTTKGYHVKDGLIYVQFGTKYSADSQLMVLLHEMTHAVNGTAFIDPRYNQFSASSGVAAKVLQRANDTVTPTILDEVTEYLKTNFPITSRMYNPKNKTDSATLGTMLYILLYEENTARSVQTLHQLSALGFDYEIKNNKAYLVSPDGKVRWFVKQLAPVSLSSLAEVKAKLNQFERDLPSDNYIADIMTSDTIEEMKSVNAKWISTAVAKVGEVNTEYYKTIDQAIDTYMSSLNSKGITFSDSQVALVRATLSKPTLLEAIDISKTDTYTIDILSRINSQLALKLNKLYALFDNIIVTENTQDPATTNQLIEELGMAFSIWNINPIKSLLNSKLAQIKLAETTNEPGASEFAAPKSFNFGDYSFTNHTGRSYMLSKKIGNKYITQEVDRTTLLPLRTNQKPIIDDAALRKRMLFVIAKKTEVAEKQDNKPTLPEPPKKPKVNEVVWQWGAWTVKNYDKDNYLIVKNITTREATDDNYEAIQIVSKETLLPDTMFGSTGKPILSPSERSNLLNWIESDNVPFFAKQKQPDGTIKKKYIPNLTEKTIIDVGRILRYNDDEYRVDSNGKAGIVLKSLSTGKLSTHSIFKLVEAYDKGELEALNKASVSANEPSSSEFAPPKLEVDSTGVKLTKAQSEFFKDSVVRDEKGNLLRVYHGTTAKEDFSIFNSDVTTNSKTFGTGFYFTDSAKTAEIYTGVNSHNNTGPIPTPNGKTMAVYLNITNPIDYKNWTIWTIHKKINKVLNLPETTPIPTQTMDKHNRILRETQNKDGIVMKSKNKANVYIAFDASQIKLVHNETPTNEPAIDRFQPPKPANRLFISNKRANKSNLKYFVKKGRILQLHDDVVAFVEGTTDKAIFDKLDKFFQVRITKGKLTRHDISNYVGTTKSINDTTWKALTTLVYRNEALANLGPTMAKFFLDKDRLATYTIIARLTKDDQILNKTNTMVSFKKLENEFNAKLNDPKNNAEYIAEYEKIKKSIDTWWGFDNEGKTEKRDDWVIDEKQLLPIFLMHFNGTLNGIDDIFTLAKRLAGQQLDRSARADSGETTDDGKVTKISSGNAAIENNATAKGKTGVYNWIDRRRRNIIDYTKTGYDETNNQDAEHETMVFEDLDGDQKYRIVEEYLYNKALDYTNNPSEQERYDADIDTREAMNDLDDVEIDKMVLYILEERRAEQATNTPITSTSPTTEPYTRKSAKDGLRNRARSLITKLAGSKVAYNRLPAEIQALIEFTPTKSRILPEAYTNLSEAELRGLSDKVADEVAKLKVAQQEARNAEKTKATIARKVAALQAKERAITEKEARVKAREKAIKEGKTLREKLRVSYETKVDKQAFTITGPTMINPKLQTILNHTWDKNTTSKVKYMDDSVQTIQNVHTATEFYKAHAADLSSMTIADIEDITEWLMDANINTSDSVAKQTFEATKFFILAYVYNETGAKHIFNSMNSNLKLQLGNHLKAIQTSAGTLLSLVKQVKDKLNPVSVITTTLFDHFEYQISDIDQDRLAKALSSGNVKDITQILHSIKAEATKNLVPEKVSTARKVAAVRSMSMTSSPMTWVRNIISNVALTELNPIASRLGNAFFPKMTATTEGTKIQYKMDGKITPEIQAYITDQFINSGFFDETVDQISKYNPSQILRHKKAGDSDIIGDMLVHAIYNQFYSESMFDTKMFNSIHAWLMRRLSDKKWVREASVKYLGKLLAETGAHLDKDGNLKKGIDDDVMKMVANAFALATTDYMHSDNMFSHIEQWLSQHSELAWGAYKTILPFATASWNWFKAAVRFSPVGLGRSIVKLTHLEQEIIKNETLWKKGESQLAPELTSYIVRRDLGSGIIGTIAFGFGAMLAAFGYISLEDDDWGTPKLRVGNLRIDVSSIFGSSSALAGAAFVKTFQDTKNLGESLDAMFDPLVDGFFFTDLLSMDANSPEGWFEWSKYQAQSVALSFMPSMVRYVSGATYTGNYRTNTLFQKAVARLPFMGQAFNVPKKTNIYTGDQDGNFWDILHRLLPYFEIITKSQSQSLTEEYGLNKEELNGTYKINGESFKTEPKETARINKLYGELNSDKLVDFYSNQSTYRVLGENDKYSTKRYSQMTSTEINNALHQLFSDNSEVAKVSAWLAAGKTYYTNDKELFNTLRKLGYSKVYIGNKGFVN